uniref:ATP synthase F0 subunit 8 n=1 Tax=Trioza remota TaxID=1715813 RepID=A0A344A2W1_9HEMI|nr:ATP synthase F0 subunit 8 [Trioza remota]AWU49102.1 ATP synthase F0 subunit 8 [Trioza remota]
MPQMSPTPWMIIFMYTTLIFIFMNTYIYFYTNKNIKFLKKSNFLKYKIKW